VHGGQFYRWVVNGWVHFDDRDRPHEARRLLALRYHLSAQVAAEYADAGFTCVAQDNIYGSDVGDWLMAVAPRPRHLVVLRPSVAVVEARDLARTRATGKVAYGGDYTVAQNDADVGITPRSIGLWLDTSQQGPDETVAEILDRRSEAWVQ